MDIRRAGRREASLPGWFAGAVLVVSSLACRAGAAQEEHPFILWTKDEAATIRRRVEREPWAQDAYRRMIQSKTSADESILANLFRYSVMGERGPGEAEKKALEAAPGAGARAAQSVYDALRYDVLYDLLTAEERKAVEARFRAEILAGIERTTGHTYDHINWLPNLVYPRILGLHVQAVALRDRELARKIFNSDFGLGWYIGWYLRDSGFYNEEFLKNVWAPTVLFLYARGCRRLGLDDLGFGYRGKQGATLRGHLETYLRLGFPCVDLGADRPHIPMLVMGDCKNKGFRYPAYGLQQGLVPGSVGRTPAQGETTRGALPIRFAFEIAHATWPDAGFGYLLSRMRGAEEDVYHPSLFFGLDPIDPRHAAPPAAPSGVYPQRGLVMLRVEEGPAYWDSPAPAVGLRLATPYCHHIQDSFSLMGFYAFNRPLIANHFHATDYSGVDPAYSNSARGHSTVMVDFAEPKTVGEVPTRHEFNPRVKFVQARGRGIFDGVDQTRALMLTREYLLDAFHLASDRPRHYQWFIQTFGHACPDRPLAWAPSQDLAGSHFDVSRERSCGTGETWSVSSVQSSGGAHREYSGLGERWFARRIGLRTTLLGEPGTTAYTAWAPVVPDASGLFTGRDRFAYGEDEPAGVLVAAVRKKNRTAFVAVHEPFETAHRIARIERLHQDDAGWAVAIHADRFTDYAMLRPADVAAGPVTVSSGSTRFAFSGYGYLRVAADRVDAEGGLRSFRVRVGDTKPGLFIAGRPAEARIEEGYLTYPAGAFLTDAIQPPPPIPPRRAGPIAIRWLRVETLCLPVGGKGVATLRLRNAGAEPVTATVALRGGPGLAVAPAAISLDAFAAGAEREIDVTVDAARAKPNRLLRLAVVTAGDGPEIQPEPLQIANGICVEHRQRAWADPAKTIYAPRYVARVHYMDSGCASLLLDPLGYRRSGAGNASYPSLARWGQDARGQEGWQDARVPKFPYFIPAICSGEGNAPPHAYEAGRHAHGRTSSIEHWFTENWIVVRYRDAKPGERVAFNWDPSGHHKNALPYVTLGREEDLARQKKPGTLLFADGTGKTHAFPRAGAGKQPPGPKSGVSVVAVFDRPDGYEHGAVRLFPPDSRLEGRYVSQPGEKPMAFTFCTEEEFPRVVKAWQANPPTGVATPDERKAYMSMFGAHLEPPEDE